MKGTTLFFALSLLLLLAGCTGSEETPFKFHEQPVGVSDEFMKSVQTNTSEVKQFFEVKCSLCHPLTRITSKRKKYDDWLMTAYSMKNHYGVLITEEEGVVIALYINRTYGK
ncbi:hypothetical protein KKA03_01855 [archaeon]|nr:hypothetical protein [archaeon]